MDLDTQAMLRPSLRHVLTESSTRPLAERLAELGWDDVLADDAPTALRMLFEIKGETLSNADALGPRLCEALGELSLADALVVIPITQTAPAGEGGDVALDGVVTSDPSGGRLVAPMHGDAGTRLVVVQSGLITAAAAYGTDPDLGLWRVHGSVAAPDVTPINLDAERWAGVVAHGRAVLAAELVGIGRHVVRTAVEYTGERVQYGRKIGSFQALQHRLASAHVLVAGAARVVDEAMSSGRPWDAMVAKHLAGRAAEMACTQAQQSYGAIGFTWEHEFHRYLRRTYVLDQLFGSWRTLEREIGDELIHTQHVPRLGVL